MRISKFVKDFIMLIICLVLILLFFNINIIFFKDKNLNNVILFIFKIFSIILLLLWIYMFDLKLNNILVLKYKIIEEEQSIRVKYFTLCLLIIPYWETLYKNYYTKIFDSKKDAISVINKHKEKIKKNRIEYFKKPDKTNKKVTYI